MAQHQSQFDVTVSVDKVINIRMAFQILFGVEYQEFFVFTHILGLFAVNAFQATLLGPVQSQFHTPTGMYGRKKNL